MYSNHRKSDLAIFVVGCAVAFLWLAPVALFGAPTYDLSRDFSLSANPSGVWSYGGKSNLAGNITLLTYTKTFSSDNGVPLASWLLSSTQAPTLTRNMGTSTAVSAGGAFTAPPGAMWLDAGYDGNPQTFGVVRFTVPQGGGGDYRIETTVRPYLDGTLSEDADYHVVKNGIEVFGEFLPPNTGTGYTNTFTLSAGDTIDFAVGRGADGIHGRSALKVQAAITYVSTNPPVSSTILSGLAEFSAASSGSFDNGFVWNTRGGDSTANLWVVDGSDPGGSLINGPGDSQAGISVALTPGVHTYSIFAGSPGAFVPHLALNLFFNGNNVAPGISVLAPLQTNANPPYPSFSANGGSSTVTLASQPVAGANSLSYSDGTNVITLTDYRWALPGVYNLDRSSAPFANPGFIGADGQPDWVGQFTLNVAAATVPVIVSHPQNLAVPAGSPATFSVVAQGHAPLIYQWYFKAGAVSGATNSSLTISNVQPANEGQYSVQVTNSFGTATSSPAMLTVLPPPPPATILSGLVEFSAASSGSFDNGFVWNTRGGDSTANLWVVDGSDPGGSLINGPGDSQAGISIALTPGVHTYSIFAGSPGAFVPYFALNLFFNGNNIAPGISVLAPLQTNANPPYPSFSANGGSSTLTLGSQPVAGANTLAYSDGTNVITLTDYRWALPGVYSLDRSSAPFGNPGFIGADGQQDWVGRITLEVRSLSNPQPLANYNLGRDFSTTNNPGGVWTYGYLNSFGSALSVLPRFLRQADPLSPNVPMDIWTKSDSFAPAVYHNGSDTLTAYSAGGRGIFPPKSTFFYAGQPGTPDTYGAIRFTVPSDGGGDYRVGLMVRPYFENGNSDSDFHVLQNGVEVFGQAIAGGNPTNYFYTNVFRLLPGARIDFAIGRGQDNVLDGSALKIEAAIDWISASPASAPEISSQPQSLTVEEGSPATFNVVAQGTPPLSYQWRLNETAIPGATGPSLTLNNARSTDEGDYSVAVSNSIGGIISASAHLAVVAPPLARYNLGRDFSTTNNPGGVWTYGYLNSFGSSISVLPRFLRQADPLSPNVPMDIWTKSESFAPAVYHNGSDTLTAYSNGGRGIYPPKSTFFYAGQPGTPDTYGVIRFTVPSSGGGDYRVGTMVRSYLESGNSDTDFHVVQNGTEVFGEFLAGGAPVNRNYTNVFHLLAGDTIDFAIGRGQDNMLDGSGLKIEASIDWLSAAPPSGPVITSQPQSLTVEAGSSATFSVEAHGTPPLSYQWRLNNGAIGGATGSSLTINNVQSANAGDYSVEVTNQYGKMVSSTAHLDVVAPPLARYNLGRDFSTTNNPGGVWTYGYLSSFGSSISVLPRFLRQADPLSPNVPMDIWTKSESFAPAVYHNGSDTLTAYSNGGRGIYPPKSTFFYAGQPGTPDTYGVIRFTVPSSGGGDYRVGTMVRSYLESGNSDTDFHVVQNGTEVFGEFLAGGAPVNRNYTNVFHLLAGDTIDFAIGRGQDNVLDGSGLKIEASIDWLSAPPNLPPVAKATVSPLFDVGGGNTNLLVLSANGVNAEVVLDGAQSSDAENEPLQYLWFDVPAPAPGQTPFAAGARTTNVFGIGTHAVALVVSDAHGAGSASVTFEVITLSEACAVLLVQVEESDIARKNKRPLEAIIKAAMQAFEAGNTEAGIGQLLALEQKIRAQIAPSNPDLAASWIQTIEQIIAASGGR